MIPPSTSVEVDSTYCPRCLTYCDVASASSGFCQVDLETASSVISCKDCPVCFSPLAVSIDADDASDERHLICHYLCGHCKWSSRECGVTSNADELIDYRTNVNDPSNEAELEKQRQKVIAEASKQLECCLRDTLVSKNRVCDDLFTSLTNMWSKKEKDEARRQRLRLGADKSDAQRGKVWSLDVLEQSLEEKRNKLASAYSSDRVLTCTTSDEEKEDGIMKTVATNSDLPTSQQVSAQMVVTNITPRCRSDLLPLPVPFRARVSRRCLAEQAAGKTGILVKPKLNPLEGDSSLRAGHGQWFKKDSSAVNSVPRVQICSYGKDLTGKKYALLIKVRNPTLSMIRLRFSSPVLQGSGENGFIDERELQNVPVDPFSQTFVNARVGSLSIQSYTPMDWLELENTEDMFLDVRSGQDEDPSEVREWEASSVIGAPGNGKTFRILATRKDSAWVEMVTTVESDPDLALTETKLAIPMGLQIEVGNGSWEASLIKRHELPEGEIDIVTLNLVAFLD